MRVLIDECVPHDIRHHLPGHAATTVDYLGWNGKKNGELLALMSANGFEVLLTVDKNLRYQQNLAAHGVAVILLVAKSTALRRLSPLIPAVCAPLAAIQPGDIVEIT